MTTDKPTPENDWKCNCCRSQFLSAQENRTDDGTQNGGAKCPVCKAGGQFTYRVETRPSELRQAGVDGSLLRELKNVQFNAQNEGLKQRAKEWLFENIDRIIAALQPAAQKTEGGALDMPHLLDAAKAHAKSELQPDDPFWQGCLFAFEWLRHDTNRAALESRASVDVWQDIETAPKDGTWILVLSDSYKGPVTAYWENDGWFTEYVECHGVKKWTPLPAAKFPELVGGRE